jgi:hypothetical protein
MSKLFKFFLISIFIISFYFLLDIFATAIFRITYSEQDSYIVNVGYIGSYLSAITSLVIVFLTAFAVYYSYSGYKKEIERVEQQRFEDHFFHLLEIHRENLKMMEIEHKSFDFRNQIGKGSYTSSKVILKMFRELMVMIGFVDKEAKEHICLINLNSVNKRASLVYLCFYYGFGSRSKEILNHQLHSFGLRCYEGELLRDIFCDSKQIRLELKNLKAQYKDNINQGEVNKKLDKIYNSMIRKKISDEADIKYKAVGGHQTRLDQYFANLLFCFELIDAKKKKNVSMELEIYKKELMSQLNIYEKILLIFHSTTSMGENFQKYILEYNFQKYIPEGMLKKEEFDMHQYFIELNQNEF